MTQKEVDVPLLKASHITVDINRSGEKIRLFENAEITLEAGETLDVQGPSGAGKSTLLRVLGRMQPVTSAKLWLKGTSARNINPQDWRTRVALVPQVGVALAGTVEENILYPWTLSVEHEAPKPDATRLRELLDAVKLTDVDLSFDANQLSVGQLARVALLRTLVTEPDVLLMDEVDAGLDADSARAVAELVKTYTDKGMGCMRVRHRDPDGFETGVLFVDDGRFVRRDA